MSDLDPSLLNKNVWSQDPNNLGKGKTTLNYCTQLEKAIKLYSESCKFKDLIRSSG